MPYFADRVKDSSTTTGTGAITLSGTPATGYQTFATAFSIGAKVPYCIADQSGANWEVGLGTLTASTTLSRDTVLAGASGFGVLVNFGAGTKDVFVTMPAEWADNAGLGMMLGQARGWAMN